MIKFRRKEFTIPEGHYTGPKDMDKVPGAVEMILKGAGVGAAGGAIAGKILKDSSAWDGALTGAKWGALGGIIAKFFLNYVHKPMTRIKYQEVDKNIRQQFGVYRMAGVTVGDSLDKRANIEEKFSFNDRNVSDYKINFAIHDDQITMYTFGISKEELDKVSKSLDYYCKKYFSMEYSAKLINQKVNSYSVDIVFTNYQVLCQFIMELSNVLNTKINLLNNNVIIEPRLIEAGEKSFSVKYFNNNDILKILSTGIIKGISSSSSLPNMISNTVQKVVIEGILKLRDNELTSLGVSRKRGEYNNLFLERALKNLHYIEGFNYTVGNEPAEVNISLVSGIFVISSTSNHQKEIDTKLWKSLKQKIHKSNTGKVVVYTYALNDLREFDMILKKLMLLKVKPNIFDK